MNENWKCGPFDFSGELWKINLADLFATLAEKRTVPNRPEKGIRSKTQLNRWLEATSREFHFFRKSQLFIIIKEHVARGYFGGVRLSEKGGRCHFSAKTSA